MKFLLDHDVPDEIERVARYWRHDVKLNSAVEPQINTDERRFQGLAATERFTRQVKTHP